MTAPLAHGIDIVEVSRVADLISRHRERSLERLFTEAERAYCIGRAREIEHLAARFAAKEAALKALGTGWAQGLGWTDIEVTRQPSGKPGLVLHGRAAEVAAELGITAWLISMSHTESTAIASVIGFGR